jgi:hypothetical protein
MIILKSTLEIFISVQESTTFNKSHVFDLVKLHKQNSSHFDKAFEQAYLKIFKCFHERANKKIPSKF